LMIIARGLTDLDIYKKPAIIKHKKALLIILFILFILSTAYGLKRTVYYLLSERMIDSELRDIKFSDLTAKMVSEAAHRGDKIALEAFDYTGRILGKSLADTVAHTSPEAIFLSGGVANSKELITVPTKKYMEEFLLPIFRNKVKILISQLPDMNVGLVGAGALAWNELKQ